jgi:hypothetical protein
MLPMNSRSPRPDRMVMTLDDEYGIDLTENLADYAVEAAKRNMPKITGSLSMTLRPVFGPSHWGIYFPDKRAWYLEMGTNPFTMNSLAGKTIPMWVDDPDGSVAKKEGKKAKTRVTVDGRRQTQIFRRAANKGQRKTVVRRGVTRTVPMSYPGAPGRIGNRLSSGQIGSPNVGVRWRHPGISGRLYMNSAMEEASLAFGLRPGSVYLVDSATYSSVTRS